MGGSTSKLDKVLADSPDERCFGLENFGNTCYCNSVLQALYFCKPFRGKVLAYASALPKEGTEENLLSRLAELFVMINGSKKKTGTLSPKKFVERLKKDNELFRSYMHQDAHEFLNYLLNQVVETLESEAKAKGAVGSPESPIVTWGHDTFQGKLVNETRCLHCETVTCREEVFMDLSLEIDQNCSLTSCLKQFSATEMLEGDDKFFCDRCCCLQEAQKRMLIKAAPTVLILHLKRFKYVESQGRMRKLMHRVVFPMELKIANSSEDGTAMDTAYSLFAVVVHVGSGPHHGHYVSLIKSHDNWLFFDDDSVDMITESQVHSTFGSTQEAAAGMASMDHGYLLLYEKTPLAA
ncbi:MAG: hypothetical protein WDW36_008814 [Sanguina aurantia]